MVLDCFRNNVQKNWPAALVTFTEKNLDGKLFCAVRNNISLQTFMVTSSLKQTSFDYICGKKENETNQI